MSWPCVLFSLLTQALGDDQQSSRKHFIQAAMRLTDLQIQKVLKQEKQTRWDMLCRATTALA